MKKTLVFAAMAVFAMASCSKDQILDEQKNEIGFSAVTENTTKANAIYSSSDPISGFTIYGEYIADKTAATPSWSSYIETLSVTWDGTAATPAKTYYWPDLSGNQSMRFFAVAGASSQALTSWNPGTAPTYAYTVDSDVEKQEDLLYAVAECDEVPSGNKVALNFRHALSQIVFRAKNTNGTINVNITDLRVANVFGSAVLTIPQETTQEQWIQSPEAEENEQEEVTFDNIWDTYSSASSYSVTGLNVNVNTSSLTSLTNDNVGNSMLLLPQTTTKWSSSNNGGSYLAIRCTIESSGVKLHDGWAVIPADFDWKPGRRYIYTFDFANGNGGFQGGEDPDPTPTTNPVLVPIDYTVTVDDFDNVNKDVNVNA